MKELAMALVKAQSEMTHASKDAINPHFKSRYATLASTWEACRAPLTKNGLCVLQQIEEDGVTTTLITTLLHISGESVTSRMRLISTKGDMQGLGSALSYARRYSLQAIVGIAQDDDDGEAAKSADIPKPKVETALEAVTRPFTVPKLAKQNPEEVTNPWQYVVRAGKKFRGIQLSDIADHEIKGFMIWIKTKADIEFQNSEEAQEFMFFAEQALATPRP